MPRQFSGERNGTGTTGYTHAKELSCTPTSHHIQVLMQNKTTT